MSDEGLHPVPRVPVVVVGAGPTGITAATLLAQYGVECVILERWPGVYPQPRAVHLDDEIFRVMGRLGIADDFAAISRPTAGLRLLDKRFHVLAEFHRDPAHSLHGFPQANMFDQPELEALLRTNLERYPNAELRGDAEVTAISKISADRDLVRVTFTDRSDGRIHQLDTEYLLGCDGANSLIRSQIGSAMRDLRFQQRWLVVDVATGADLHQWDGVHQICDPVRAATYMRIGESRYRWEFQLQDAESAAAFDTVGKLRPLIAPWVADVPNSALTLLRVTEYTFRAQIADRWRRDNVFILGDAAHLTPPFIGQGLGTGVRDAMNLSWKIAAVRSGMLAASILDSYERERKPHTRQLIRLALGIGWAMTGGGRLGDRVRRAVLPRLGLMPGLRDKVVDSTTPALSASPLVRKTRRFRPARQIAGTLCPNPVLPGGQRLDEVAGTGFAVIVTAPLTANEKATLRRRGVVPVIARPGSVLAQWLRAGQATAAIVRPDRTVMRTGRNQSALCLWTANTLKHG
ncbi:3-(3-hydroxy-phenyl)propionate/3-hydroxycinnamic acid hydroxylase [Mycobacterium basiliense]|uniref:3-(3-hydroxy-phenyl)propionate/3-hydroxycinnamic acid hydroxylase n=1 Tax=Mycobacterium basiliense TaxID=2094119 RepID=A0A447GFI9_9MYCO|nr:bifunctional 3-(3-hydroxy-phenyl)propionate/3-hydroxycinnamic acid hydroxylase [Mycobacterium basiliense]VDM89208.1 3-(3-hydroxy-phenyl)propionate/3-hydroxycinnamic acid hydroxylase [Mycobacterium basiliense]